MKKILNSISIVFGSIILILMLLLICFAYVLYLPFDIVRYYRMPYYKDLGVKYRLFITSSDVVRLYNRIVREQLPIEYVKNNDFEYFVADGQVLLCGWGNEDFKNVDGEWFFISDGESDTAEITMKEAMSEEIELIKPEHRDLPAKFLIIYEDVADAGEFERAKKCPYFRCVFSADQEL